MNTFVNRRSLLSLIAGAAVLPLTATVPHAKHAIAVPKPSINGGPEGANQLDFASNIAFMTFGLCRLHGRMALVQMRFHGEAGIKVKLAPSQ